MPAAFRRGSLVVRDVETERNAEVEVQLRTRGHAAAESFERAVRWSASEVVALIDAGAHVALRTERTHLASGTGLQHRARLLSFLALAKPESESAAEVP